MKSLFLIAFCLLCLSLFAQSAKIALIVAVDQYPKTSGWPPIHAANDVALIRSALIRQGFESRQIFVLQDSAATRGGILQALEVQVLSRIKPGDQVVFHFSGHGQQVRDQNGDELDGYDEAIVPYDAPMAFQKGVYEGENLIRDDDLNKVFSKIRKKLGPKGHLLLILDSCHSGTGSRGLAFARGTDHKMADSAWIKAREKRDLVRENDQFSATASGRLAPMAAFFGAAANQLNYETQDREGRPVGSLSYAFSTAFSNLHPQSSYRGLFEQIRLEMAVAAPRQTPQAEGELDRLVLGGHIVSQAPYCRLTSLFDTAGVEINGGWLHGFTEGSIVGFFPPETRDIQSAQPYLKGVIAESRPLQCIVRPEAANVPAVELLQSAWVMLMEQNPGDLTLQIRLQMPESALKTALLEAIRAQKALQLLPDQERQTADLSLLQNGKQLELIGSDEQTLTRFDLGANTQILVGRILQEIKTAGQIKFLRGLKAPPTANDLRMELIPVEVNEKDEVIRRLSLQDFTGPDGLVRFPEGTCLKIRLSNPGMVPAYFTLIDIEPYQRFTIIAPEEGSRETAEEYRIAAGAQLEIPKLFRVAPPYGQEIFKLIFTRKPIDLRSIKASGGAITRGAGQISPLEKLFSDTFFSDELQRRGGQTVRTSPGEMGVLSLNFIIEPRR